MSRSGGRLQVAGAAKLATTTIVTAFGSLAANSVDLGLAVTVLGTGLPFTVEWGGLVQVSPNGQAAAATGRCEVVLVNAAAPTVQLDALQVQVLLGANQQYSVSKRYLEAGLAPGATRTYALRAFVSSAGGNAGASLSLFGRDVGCDFTLIARQG